MNCPKCGAYLSESTRFCSRCGCDVLGRRSEAFGAGAWTPHDNAHDVSHPEIKARKLKKPGTPSRDAQAANVLRAWKAPKPSSGLKIKGIVTGAIIVIVTIINIVNAATGSSAGNTREPYKPPDSFSGWDSTRNTKEPYEPSDSSFPDDDSYVDYIGDGFLLPYNEEDWQLGEYDGKPAFFPAERFAGDPAYEDMRIVIEEVTDTGRDLSLASEREAVRVEYIEKYRESLLAEGFRGLYDYESGEFTSIWGTDEERERHDSYNFHYDEHYYRVDPGANPSASIYLVANGKGSEIAVIISRKNIIPNEPVDIWDSFAAYDTYEPVDIWDSFAAYDLKFQ